MNKFNSKTHRDQVIEAYAERVVDDMEMSDLMQFAYEQIEGSFANDSDADVIAVIEQVHPELLEPSPWEDDVTQFPRLLHEIYSIGLTDKQMDDLCNSMDLKAERITELFERAETAFEADIAGTLGD